MAHQCADIAPTPVTSYAGFRADAVTEIRVFQVSRRLGLDGDMARGGSGGGVALAPVV